jgi:pimeloyl-ACP methyl ester carboxylesterase
LEKTLNVANHTCQTLYNEISGVPIVFLHGLSYTISIWQQIGILQLLIEKHIPFLALDMPYGLKSHCHPKTKDTAKNVEVVYQAIESIFGSAIPLLVGASLGGHIALKYGSRFPVKGLLLIAPSQALQDNLVNSYSRVNFPVRIIWGTHDNIISGEDMRTLAGKLLNAKLLVYDGASHSAYKDKPEWFNHDLLELYAKVE